MRARLSRDARIGKIASAGARCAVHVHVARARACRAAARTGTGPTAERGRASTCLREVRSDTEKQHAGGDLSRASGCENPPDLPLEGSARFSKTRAACRGAWQRVPSNQCAASWRVLRGRHAARCRRCSPSHPTLPRCHSADLRKRARCGLASREGSVLCLARTRVESDSMHGFRERRTRNHITGRPGARRKRGPCLRCLSGPPLDGGRRLRCGARRR